MCVAAGLDDMGRVVFVLVVDEEAPEQDIVVFAAGERASINIGAHFDGDLEFYATITEEGEE